jgi:hypothetical protein
MGAGAWEDAMADREATTIDCRTAFSASGPAAAGRSPRLAPINLMPESPDDDR